MLTHTRVLFNASVDGRLPWKTSLFTSKRRRLTFIECPADSLASMIDIAKVVDIVLLMIDGNYGFEMETMEFLNVLSSSGMPGNVFGILTHLDLFRKQETLKLQKKRLPSSSPSLALPALEKPL